MSVMREDDQIELHPATAATRRTWPILSAMAFAYKQGDVAPRHGTIVSAAYSLGGEAVMVVHLDSRPSEILANAVLIGRQAHWALEHLDSPAEPISIDLAAPHRLAAEQACAIPDAASRGTGAAMTW